MSDIKKFKQAVSTIAQFLYEPGDTENSNRFEPLQHRMLFNICDVFGGNIHWILNTGGPGAQRQYEFACRVSKGGEIDLKNIEEADTKRKTLSDQSMLADEALEVAKQIYLEVVGEDYVFVPYADRKTKPSATSTDSAIEAAAAKLRAKYGVKA